MLRLAAAALLPLALASAEAVAACPLCAGDSRASDAVNIWPVVGAFLLVPWILGAVVVTVVKREARKTRLGEPAAAPHAG